MPKFIIKHGCCYIPPVENDSSTTCQVFANPDFNKNSPSDAICRMGKSSPDFGSQYHKPYIENDSEEYLTKSTECHLMENSSDFLNSELASTTQEINHSFVTLYGVPVKRNNCSTMKQSQENNITVSETSVYHPTSKTLSSTELSNSTKVLDCITKCLWKCASWCQ